MPFNPTAGEPLFTGVPVPDATLRSPPRLLTGLRRGISRTCPACGQGELFCGYLAVRPVCAVCGNDNEGVVQRGVTRAAGLTTPGRMKAPWFL